MIESIVVIYAIMVAVTVGLVVFLTPSRDSSNRVEYYTGPDDVRRAYYQAAVDSEFRWGNHNHHHGPVHRDSPSDM